MTTACKLRLIALFAYVILLVWVTLELYNIPDRIKTIIRQRKARRKNRKAYENTYGTFQKMKNN